MLSIRSGIIWQAGVRCRADAGASERHRTKQDVDILGAGLHVQIHPQIGDEVLARWKDRTIEQVGFDVATSHSDYPEAKIWDETLKLKLDGIECPD